MVSTSLNHLKFTLVGSYINHCYGQVSGNLARLLDYFEPVQTRTMFRNQNNKNQALYIWADLSSNFNIEIRKSYLLKIKKFFRSLT